MHGISRTVPWVITCCLACVLAYAMAMRQSARAEEPRKKVVQAEEFVLVDAGGTKRATLGLTGAATSLGLFDEEGKMQALLNVGKRGAALAFWRGGVLCATVGVVKTESFVSLLDENRTTRLHLSVKALGPAVGLFDDKGQARIGLAVDEHGPILEFRDAEGKARWRFRETGYEALR